MSLRDGKPLPEFTQEELSLFLATDEELKNTAYNLSFDEDAFVSRVARDRFSQILHAHLHMDHVIGLILLEEFKRKDAIDLDRMSFSQKLQLISALALVPEDFVPPVRLINTMRNRLAHDLNCQISDHDVSTLFSKLPRKLQSSVIESEKQNSKCDRLIVIIVHILYAAENFRQVNAHRRLEVSRHMLRVRSFLKKLDAVIEKYDIGGRG